MPYLIRPLFIIKIITIYFVSTQGANDYNLITQSLSFFRPIPENLTSKCKNHTNHYLNGISNFSTWAISMMDANGRYPSGTLSGNICALGNFDQCLETKNPTNEFSGKYCLFELQFATNFMENWQNSVELNEFIEMATSGRRKFEVGDDWINGTLLLSSYSRGEWALCLPSSCTFEDVKILGKTVVNRFTENSGINVSLFLEESRCYHKNYRRSFEFIDFVALFIFGILASVTLISTVFSFARKREKISGWGVRLMSYFSLSNSWSALKKEPSEAITCIVGIRSLSTAWVVMTHQFVLMPQIPFINKVETLKTNGNYLYYPMWNSYLDVDTFLLVSGLLRSQSLMKNFSSGHGKMWNSAIRRYFRLTPTYLIVLLFFASVFDRLDAGPFWNYTVGRNSEACRKFWWQNLLYINNYVSHNEKCGLHTWYLSADMQLFLAAPLIIYPLWKWNFYGTILWIFFLIISIASPFLTTMIYQLPATFVPTVGNSKLNEYTHRIYMATHNRMSPYLVGIYLGKIFHKSNFSEISKWKLTLGWMTSLVVMYGCVYGAMGITSVHHTTNYEPWEAALYGGFHRFAWAVAVAWLIYACHMGYGGPIDNFLSCKFFGYLGRLSYCVYLSHMAIILYNSGVLQTPKQLQIYLTIRDFLGDFSCIFMVSIFLYVFVEAPFQSVTKFIYR